MIRPWALLLLVLPAALCGACAERPGAPDAAAKPASAPAEGAFCEEHGVVEALCTKCNPALIPVFKAKGDWCEEHGFALSICPVHHPERQGRPAADISGEEAPAEGTKVRFKTKETARLAGIRTEKAQARPLARTVTAPARLVYDAARVAHLNSRVSGVVREIRVDVGSKVRPGVPLVVIESADVGSDASDLRAARTRVEVAQANLRRVERLHDEGIAPEIDLLAAQRELDEAKGAFSTAESALGMVGAAEGGAGRYTLASPIQGVVTRRGPTVGEAVSGDDLILEIVDTSTLWAEIDVPEALLAAVAPGQRVVLSLQNPPGTRTGQISYLAPEIDARPRTAKARVPLANPDGQLRANLFAEAAIEVAHSAGSVLVPVASVQRARSVQLVFVRRAEDLYEARRVRPGARDGDWVEITGSVRPGDEVVTDGSFLLKTETLRGSIGAGCCEVE